MKDVDKLTAVLREPYRITINTVLPVGVTAIPIYGEKILDASYFVYPHIAAHRSFRKVHDMAQPMGFTQRPPGDYSRHQGRWV
jgi:hypothetical protein